MQWSIPVRQIVGDQVSKSKIHARLFHRPASVINLKAAIESRSLEFRVFWIITYIKQKIMKWTVLLVYFINLYLINNYTFGLTLFFSKMILN